MESAGQIQMVAKMNRILKTNNVIGHALFPSEGVRKMPWTVWG